MDHLSNPEYQKKLYELLKFYDADLQELIDLATIACDGNRPKNLENEIYSVFHHICRSVFHKNDVQDACEEIETAINSHLVRVQSDAYKITLDRTLERAVNCIKNYELLLLDRDFRDVLPDAITLFQKIRRTYKDTKNAYCEAKRYERIGDRPKTVERYNNALKGVPILDAMIEDFEDDGRFSIALLSVKKKARSEKRRMWIVLIGAVISGLGGLATLLGFLPR